MVVIRAGLFPHSRQDRIRANFIYLRVSFALLRPCVGRRDKPALFSGN